jgi:hypothetical protein
VALLARIYSIMAIKRTKFKQGVLRRDYHRPNRKENKSNWTRSSGRNVSVSTVADLCALQIPDLSEADLKRRAVADWKHYHDGEYRLSKQKTSTERKCFEYIRHRQTGLDRALSRLYGAANLLAIREFCDAVTEKYEWLRDECNRYYERRANQARFNTFRVVKRPRTLTSLMVDEFNESQATPEQQQEPFTDQDEVPAYFNALSSLHQDRFLLLPPFLKPQEVRERRFGDNANDNWWEWEEELGLAATEGRPNPKQAQQ